MHDGVATATRFVDRILVKNVGMHDGDAGFRRRPPGIRPDRRVQFVKLAYRVVVEDPDIRDALPHELGDKIAADEATTTGDQPAHQAAVLRFHATRGRIRATLIWLWWARTMSNISISTSVVM